MPQFKAYNAERKRPHKIPTPPTKISFHRLQAGVWAARANEGPAPSRVQKRRAAKRPSRKVPKRAIDVLRAGAEDSSCLHCGRWGDDKEVCVLLPYSTSRRFVVKLTISFALCQCGNHCYRAWRKQFVPNSIDIREAAFGYGAFVKPGHTLKRGAYLDEYLGDLLPPGELDSLYCFEIPGACVVDAEKAGNWTRFVNSHCRPNVGVWGGFVGKRHVVVMEATRDIGPEEEIVWNYGRKYFELAGFKCGCDKHQSPHWPGR